MSKYHYVYRITNINCQKYYYGVRSSECLPKDDSGYWSSSKTLKPLVKENPDHFKKKIIRILESRKEAVNFEIFLHNRFDVGRNPSFYNKAKQTSTGFDNQGVSPSEETRQKQIVALKTRVVTDETKRKLSEIGKRRIFTEEHKQKMRKKHRPLKQPMEPQKIVICPHCNKSGGNVMKRHHFDKCKFKRPST